MKKISLLLTILISIHLSAQTYEWVNTFGSTGSDRIFELTTMPNGDIVTTGYFNGTVDFDPSSSTANKTAVGNRDIVICRYGENGSFKWVKTFGGSANEQGLKVKSDLEENIYTTGTFSGTVDFDPGTSISNLSSNGGNDIFISKLDSAGDYIWAKSIGGTADDEGLEVLPLSNGDVVVCGSFRGTVDFDPGSGVASRTSSGGKDIFICKLDSNGNFKWVNTYGSNSSSALNERAYSMITDGNDNIIFCGGFTGTVDFDPSLSTSNLTSNGIEDAYVSKIDSSGSLIWAYSFGGTDEVIANDIALGRNNIIYIAGFFRGTADLDPGTTTSNYSSNGSRDAFIVKLDSSASLIWAKTIGGSSAETSAGITVDNDDNITFTGYFFGNTDFDPGPNNFTITNQGGGDSYVCQLDKNGDFKWAYAIASSGNEISNGTTTNNKGSFYIVGAFSNTVDFDPQSTSATATSNGNYDAFLQKVFYCDATYDTLFEQACNTYTSPSGNYTWDSSGTFHDTITNAIGCDSILSINLFVTKSLKTINPSICSAYNSPSGNYTWDSTGTYYDTIPNGLGCDSIFTINLTILKSDTSFTALACKNYISPSGKTNWNSSGIYLDTLTSSYGCDSILTITLALIQPDTSVTANDPVLTSNNTASNVSYQWLDCSNSYTSINGANSRVFTANYNSSFAVEIDNSGCIDTSACYQILTIGLTQASRDKRLIKIYPNPSEGNFNVELPVSYSSSQSQYKLIDITGKTILSGSISKANSKINSNTLNKGVYFLQLFFNNGDTTIEKVILN